MSFLVGAAFVVVVGALAYVFRARIESWFSTEVTAVENKITGKTGPTGA